MIRRIVVAGALVASLALAVPGLAAASSPAFHGTFNTGIGYWSTSETPSAPQLGPLPLEGVWNLNASDTHVAANFVVFHLMPPQYAEKVMEPVAKGLHAHFVQGWMRLEPVTTAFGAESAVGRVFPDLIGRVNDPAAGTYLFFTYFPGSMVTMVASLDANTGDFFYAGVPEAGSPMACPAPSDEVTDCFDSVKVIGHAG